MEQLFSSVIELISSDVFGHFRFEWSDFLAFRCVNTAASRLKYNVTVNNHVRVVSYGISTLLEVTFYGNGFVVTVTKENYDSNVDLGFTAEAPLGAIDSAATFIRTAETDAILVDCPQTRQTLKFVGVDYDVYSASRVLQTTNRGVLRHVVEGDYKLSDLELFGYHCCPNAVLWTNCHYPVVSISERLIRAGPIRLYNARMRECACVDEGLRACSRACARVRALKHTYMYGMVMYVSAASPEEIRRGNEVLACDLVVVEKLQQ